jgi:hypothetical protein
MTYTTVSHGSPLEAVWGEGNLPSDLNTHPLPDPPAKHGAHRPSYTAPRALISNPQRQPWLKNGRAGSCAAPLKWGAANNTPNDCAQATPVRSPHGAKPTGVFVTSYLPSTGEGG